jgi:Holliday junction resolvase RusA-like endonuclease
VNHFVIPGRLPGLNEIIGSARTAWADSAKQKKKWTQACALAIGPAHIGSFSGVCVSFDWYEKDNRRDPDNVMAGQKFIFDALVAQGWLEDDTRKCVKSISHRFHTDAANPRIEVDLWAAEDKWTAS